jgi:hypothetical protein
MLIWKGWGLLVIVFAIGAMAIGQLIQGGDTASTLSTSQVFIWRSIPLILAAIPVWIIGRKKNTKTTKTLVDPETGENVTLESGGGHALFFLPMEYWAPIMFVLAIAMPFL